MLLVPLWAAPGFGQEEIGFLQLVERDIQRIADNLTSSVVTIQAITRSTPAGSSQSSARRGAVVSKFIGSGVVFDTNGHILTTGLVASGRDRFIVELPDHRQFDASLVGSNNAADVAVLRLNTRPRGLVPPGWGDSEQLRTGSIIVVLGNSFGFHHSVTWGTVNGFRPDGTAIQMNISISAGNSGGAVVNSAGDVVGLVKAKVSEPNYVPPMRIRSPGQTNESWYLPEFKLELPTSGVGLAVPINTATEVAQRIIDGEGQDYPYLGVYVSDLHSWLAQHYHTDRGVVIAKVADNTPAHTYGLLQGDLIRSFNGMTVQNARHLRQLINKTSPGDRVLIDILRGGTKPLKVSLTMGRTGIPEYVGGSRQFDLRSLNQAGAEWLEHDSTMNVERLNEIRTRILKGTDTTHALPVDHSPPE